MQEPVPSGVENLPFEDLVAPLIPSDPERFYSGMRGFFEERHNWKVPHSAITLLRQLNRFFPTESESILSTFWPQLVSLLSNPKPAVAKAILLYFAEVIRHSTINEEIIAKMEPLLAIHSYSDKKFIQSEARLAYSLLVQKYTSPALIFSLSRTAFEEKGQVEELAIRTLDAVCEHLKGSLASFELDTFKCIFFAVKKCLQKKGPSYKSASNILRTLHEGLGSENFTKLVYMLKESGDLTSPDFERIRNAFEPLRDGTSRRLNDARMEIKILKERSRVSN